MKKRLWERLASTSVDIWNRFQHDINSPQAPKAARFALQACYFVIPFGSFILAVPFAYRLIGSLKGDEGPQLVKEMFAGIATLAGISIGLASTIGQHDDNDRRDLVLASWRFAYATLLVFAFGVWNFAARQAVAYSQADDRPLGVLFLLVGGVYFGGLLSGVTFFFAALCLFGGLWRFCLACSRVGAREYIAARERDATAIYRLLPRGQTEPPPEGQPKPHDERTPGDPPAVT